MRKILYIIGIIWLLFLSNTQANAQCDAQFSWYMTSVSGLFYFQDSSGNQYTQEHWDFGDGTRDSTFGFAQHKYNSAGTYKVCRIVMDSKVPCADTFCVTVVYTTGCDAHFSSYIKGDSVYFVDNSTKAATHIWTFGDGTTSTAKNPIHKYSSSLSWATVCLQIYDSTATCSDQYCVTIALPNGNNCNADFDTYVSGSSVSFYPKDYSSKIYRWTFGDGDTSSSFSPYHKYQTTSIQTFNVCHYVSDSSMACSDSVCKTVTVYPDTCDVSFTLSQYKNVVALKANSNVATTHHYWTFGDGHSVSGGGGSVTYTYQPVTTATTYQVCHYIMDSTLGCNDTSCQYIIVYPDSCNAAFSTQISGNSVRFSGVYQANRFYYWTFGDGATSTGNNSVSIVHTYSKQGTYNACLTVWDTTGCQSTYCDSIVVGGSATGCQADFSFYVMDTIAHFKNMSSSNTTQYLWSFGDGTSSTQKNPSHHYTYFGTYTVCLYAYDSGCVDSICKSVTIDSMKSCTAFFRVAVDTNTKYKLYLINGSSNKSSHQYYWNFGDGGTSTQRNPSHHYSTFGRYNVCLTVIDSSANCYDTYCDTLGLDSLGRLLKVDGFDIEVLDQLGVGNKLNKNNFRIYPNPTSGLVNIELVQGKSEGAIVRIYSMNGILISEVEMEADGKANLDIAHQPDGLYLIEISGKQVMVREKFIKLTN
ncbi:MAG: PKD domain-containing protein [Flavobacteriales bacterium]|nr:PKD domain-containing protein [Flavobacteriales bacterium]